MPPPKARQQLYDRDAALAFTLPRTAPGQAGRYVRSHAGYDKARLYQPGLVIPPLAPTSLRRDNLAELALERLVDFAREVRIKLAKLGSFRDKALVRALDVVALDLNRLF